MALPRNRLADRLSANGFNGAFVPAQTIHIYGYYTHARAPSRLLSRRRLLEPVWHVNSRGRLRADGHNKSEKGSK